MRGLLTLVVVTRLAALLGPGKRRKKTQEPGWRRRHFENQPLVECRPARCCRPDGLGPHRVGDFDVSELAGDGGADCPDHRGSGATRSRESKCRHLGSQGHGQTIHLSLGILVSADHGWTPPVGLRRVAHGRSPFAGTATGVNRRGTGDVGQTSEPPCPLMCPFSSFRRVVAGVRNSGRGCPKPVPRADIVDSVYCVPAQRQAE